MEVEYSLWATNIEHNEVLNTCVSSGIPIVAYSYVPNAGEKIVLTKFRPLGHGFLTGQIRKFEDIPEGDFRRFSPRFQPDVFDENLKLLHKVETFAKKKGVTPAQLALAWVMAQHKSIIPIPGATAKSRVLENNKAAGIQLTQEELKELRQLLDSTEVKGDRYPKQYSQYLEG